MATRGLIDELAEEVHLPPEQARRLVKALFTRLQDEIDDELPPALPSGAATLTEPVPDSALMPSGPSPRALAAALRSWPARRLRRLAEHLRQQADLPAAPEALDEAALDDLEIRNFLRVLAALREVEERSVPGPALEARLGVTRQRLQQLREEHQLFALRLPFHRELFYPVWQFGSNGKPLAGLPRVLAATALARLDPLSLDGLMVSATAGRGRRLAEQLRAGQVDRVVASIRAADEGG